MKGTEQVEVIKERNQQQADEKTWRLGDYLNIVREQNEKKDKENNMDERILRQHISIDHFREKGDKVQGRTKKKILDGDDELSRAQILQNIAGKIKEVKIAATTHKKSKREVMKQKLEELETKIQFEMNKKNKKGTLSRSQDKFIHQLMDEIQGLSGRGDGKKCPTPINQNSSWFSNNKETSFKKERSNSILTPFSKKQKLLDTRKKEYQILNRPQCRKTLYEVPSSGSRAKITFTYTSPSPQTPRPHVLVAPPTPEKKSIVTPTPPRAACSTCGRNCLCKAELKACKKCGRKCKCPPYHRFS